MTTTIIPAGQFDPLQTFETVLVRTRDLREGMILCDELGFSCAILDHRTGGRHGCTEWLVEDADRGGWYTTGWAVSRQPTVRVAKDHRVV